MSGPGSDSPRDTRETITMFEWRLLQLERSRDASRELQHAYEDRVRIIEKKADVLEERVVGLQDKVNRIDENVEMLTSDRYKNLWGFAVTIIAVVAASFLPHLLGIAK